MFSKNYSGYHTIARFICILGKNYKIHSAEASVDSEEDITFTLSRAVQEHQPKLEAQDEDLELFYAKLHES